MTDHRYDLDRLVPLGALVAEGLADTVDALAKRIGDDVFLDDVGLRCCTRETARALFAERESKKAADRQRAARHRAELAEVSRRNKSELRGGRPAQPNSNAFADAHDPDHLV